MGQAEKTEKAERLISFIGAATMMAMLEGHTSQWYQSGTEITLLLATSEGERTQKSWQVEHLSTEGTSWLPAVKEMIDRLAGKVLQ